MEEAVREQLKQAEQAKEELKRSLDTLSAQSSSLLEVSVRLKVVDVYFESIVSTIEKKRDEALNEIRVTGEEVRAREERVRDLRSEDFDTFFKREKRLKEWEREIERRERRVVEREEAVEERRKELRLREERVGILRSGIFGEIHREKKALNEREIEMSVEEREAEVRAMSFEEERMKLAMKIEDRMKALEWRGKRLDQKKKEVDVKVKEVDDRKLNLKPEKNAIERRAAKLEIKEKKMAKEHCKMKRALSCLAQELERTTDENKALQKKVLLLTQKHEFMAKSYGMSGASREEESVANQLGVIEVPGTFNASTTLDGRTLQMYINGMASNDESWQDEVQTILQRLSEPAKIVLDAMEGFYPPHLSIDGKQFDASIFRKACICLLRTLRIVSPSVNPVLIGEALKLAFEWEKKMTVTVDNPLEVMGFLELVMTYGLAKEFDGFELLKLSRIAYAESTPLKLLQDLGCADSISPNEITPYDTNSEFTNTKASNIAFVKNLINENHRLQALEYICEFDLEDYFPVSTMVEVHVNYLKQNSRKLREEGGNSTVAQKEAAQFEIAALKDLIKCIESHRLQARYSPSSLNELIAQLEKHYCSKKRASPCPNSNPHISPRTKLRSVGN